MLTCAAVFFIVLTITCNFSMATIDYWDTCDCSKTRDCDCGNEEIIRSKRQGKYREIFFEMSPVPKVRHKDFAGITGDSSKNHQNVFRCGLPYKTNYNGIVHFKPY